MMMPRSLCLSVYVVLVSVVASSCEAQVTPWGFNPAGGIYSRGPVITVGSGPLNYYGCHHAATWRPPLFVGAPWGLASPSYVFVGLNQHFPVGYSYGSPFFTVAPGPFIYGMDSVVFPNNPYAQEQRTALFMGQPRPTPSLSTVFPASSHASERVAFPSDVDGGIQDPSQRPVMESSTAAKLKSLHRQAFGDAKLRARQWSAAYSDYRAAVDSAPDRAEAHFRLGCVFLAMNHFSSAVREFKRAVFLDPVLIQTGDRLETIFGPDSQITRSSILNKVADWLRADIRAPDRLFLMGLVLHFEDDSRSRGVLEAAQRMANERSVFSDHITAFIKLPIEKSDSSPLKSDSFPLPPIPDSSEPSTQLPPLQPNPSVPATGSQPSAPQSAPSSSLPPPPVPTPEP